MALHGFGSQTPPSSLYWPLESMATSALSPEEAKPKSMSTARTNDTKTPARIVSPPSPHHQSLQPTPKTMDPSKLRPKTIRTNIPKIIVSRPSFAAKSLHPPREPGNRKMLHPRYIPGVKCEEPPALVTNKGERDSEDDDHEPRGAPAPKREEPPDPTTKKRKRDSEDDDHEPRCCPTPSLVSNNICRHESCPIKLAHETGTYRHLDQDPRLGDEKAMEKTKKLFGDSNPPLFVWADVLVILKTSDGVLDVVGQKRREWALKCVTGFAKAHFKAGMTEEVVGNLLSGGLRFG